MVKLIVCTESHCQDIKQKKKTECVYSFRTESRDTKIYPIYRASERPKQFPRAW